MDISNEQRTWARVVGICILAKYVLELSGDYVSIIARSGETVAETASYAAAHPVLWRTALLSVEGAWITIGVLAYALYVVLEPVNKRLAQLAFVLRLGASFVGAASLMFRVAQGRLYLASATADLFTTEQFSALDGLLRRGAGAGVYTAWILMAAGNIVFFLLFARSGYIPRTLARAGIVTAALLAAASCVMFVYPSLTNQLKLLGLPGLLVDIVVAVWLLSKGLTPEPQRTSRPPGT